MHHFQVTTGVGLGDFGKKSAAELPAPFVETRDVRIAGAKARAKYPASRKSLPKESSAVRDRKECPQVILLTLKALLLALTRTFDLGFVCDICDDVFTHCAGIRFPALPCCMRSVSAFGFWVSVCESVWADLEALSIA